MCERSCVEEGNELNFVSCANTPPYYKPMAEVIEENTRCGGRGKGVEAKYRLQIPNVTPD